MQPLEEEEEETFKEGNFIIQICKPKNWNIYVCILFFKDRIVRTTSYVFNKPKTFEEIKELFKQHKNEKI